MMSCLVRIRERRSVSGGTILSRVWAESSRGDGTIASATHVRMAHWHAETGVSEIRAWSLNVAGMAQAWIAVSVRRWMHVAGVMLDGIFVMGWRGSSARMGRVR